MDNHVSFWNISVNPSNITTWYESNAPKRMREDPDAYFNLNNSETNTTNQVVNQEKKETPANLKDNLHHNRISKVAFKKIKKAIDYAVFLASPKNLPTEYTGKDFKFRLNFVTLTLPAEQMHSDTELKKLLLQPLLNQFRQKFKVNNYVWRAERQKNGNLHFHLLTDKWLSWADLRYFWNKYLDKHGYIDKYRANQLEWHKDGFRPRPELFNKWSYKDQHKAYIKGMRTNWIDPNTVDVHSLQNVKNIKNYFVKAMASPAHQAHNDANPKALISELTKEGQLLNGEIEGRLWGCSYELTNLEGAREVLDSSLTAEMQRLQADKSIHSVYSDYYTYHCVSIRQLKAQGYNAICELFEFYIKTHFPAYRVQNLFTQ